MSRLNLAFVLAVALLAVAAHAQIYTYSIKYTYYNTATCAATPTGMIEFENGTCGVLNPGASSAVSCSETGGASGNTCMGTTCNDTCSFVDYSGSTWDQVNCMINSASSAQGITCIRTLVPAAPVEAPVEEPIAAPIAEPAVEPTAAPVEVPAVGPTVGPVAPTAPSAPGTTPADGALITRGNISVAFWFSTNCASGAFATVPLFANYSKCQTYVNGATTYYFRADCYTTGFSKVQGCEDATCTTCADLPSTESGTCFVVSGFSPLNSATVTCPANAPNAAHSVVASFVFVVAAIMAIALF